METITLKGSNFSYADIKGLKATSGYPILAHFVYPNGTINSIQVNKEVLLYMIKENNMTSDTVIYSN